ncbi:MULTISPECIES: RluA family pseudouridine synthase [Pseudothermotoga]|jgi:23S rRNA pseudouridine955/2504/2580 synthase|uniref:RluA family pseudouridine synthase n=1 Tax=Pseudothermotoga TaxID=1643951 RepID=UPI0004060FE2|nr:MULTISPECIES: RluA family pseudouridine synthase [Pseudothermotoga]KUK22025.1 MAG: Pseudouridine synthase [Pseudothermotoga lettingae]MDI3493877.1 rRNA pseudouridine synthase [Pseudothermotoga sp.]HBJ80340.1 RluA family pseudouridine synthase [Pseudothermotoga sp.]HBT26228.1 RluA family pseudouridine synthase [Pseudothermotoga sp.]
MENKIVELSINEENSYRRLDKFLRNELKAVPLSEIYKLLRTGCVQVNGKTVRKPYTELYVGDKVTIKADLAIYRQKKDLPSIPLKLDILYEDDNLLILNKKAGITIHPSEKTRSTTLIQGLHFYGAKKGFKPHLVHRLDRDTSGALVIAKNVKTARTLSHMFRNRLVKKEYITLVSGKIFGDGFIDKPLDGSEALTEYKVLENFRDTSLLRVILHTGRTHQIRKHFALIGNPVVGDILYGDKKVNELFKKKHNLRRQFLHCIRISFTNPSEPGVISIKAPLPDDLERVIKGLKK